MRLKFPLIYIFLIWTVMCHSSGLKVQKIVQPENSQKLSNYLYVSGSESTRLPRQISSDELCPQSPNVKIICSCYPEPATVRKAQCWIIYKHLTPNGQEWNRFLAQNQLRELTFITITGGILSFIPEKIFKSLKNLKKLAIRYANIEKLLPKTFYDLQMLEELNLEQNRIKILKEDFLMDSKNLRCVNLEQNEIFQIERGAFKNLPALRNVSLHFNKLSTLPEGIFMENITVIYLALSYNDINMLTNSSFKGLSRLKFLQLDNNQLTGLSQFLFTELWELEELNLSNNFISKISNRAFEGLVNLQVLNLQNNKITFLAGDIFLSTTSLYKVFLQNNSLESLTKETIEPIVGNLIEKSGVVEIQGNNFICDCRLRWIFDFLNKTLPLRLKNSFNEIVCTLINPSAGDFKVPLAKIAINYSGLSEDGINDGYNNGVKSYKLHESYFRKNKLRNQTTTEEPKRMPVNLTNLKKKALICGRVNPTEQSLSNNISGSNHLKINFIRDITVIHLSIMIFVMSCALMI